MRSVIRLTSGLMQLMLTKKSLKIHLNKFQAQRKTRKMNEVLEGLRNATT